MKKLKNFLLHALSIFLIILSLGAFSFSAFSGILVLLSGMLCSPLLRRVIEKRLGKRLKGIVLYVGAAVLFLAGIMSTPTSDSPDLGKEVIAESTVDLSEAEELIASPTSTPTWKPTASPTLSPTKEPTALPTQAPTKDPIATPMLSPTRTPAKESTAKPTGNPTAEPSLSPTKVPTQAPIEQPAEPTVQNPADLQTQTVTNNAGISAQQEPAEASQSEISSGSTTGVTGGSNFGDAIAQGGYIGNRNNHKLHRSTCKTLPKESNQVYFSTREEAVNAGYSDPCKNCNP
ncbi:MAG: hypothetical protein K2N15_12135 [Lachnospiraceae bacterium]|nr:hypothetical protein [Lachnospiraceae bacterium]